MQYIIELPSSAVSVFILAYNFISLPKPADINALIIKILDLEAKL